MFYSHYVEFWTPQIKCPLTGNYTVNNMDFDVSFPLSLITGTYRWLVFYKFFEMKTHKMVFCFITQAVISDKKEMIRKLNVTSRKF